MSLRYPKNVPGALNHVWLYKEGIAKTGDAGGNAALVLFAGINKLVDEAIFRETEQWPSRSSLKCVGSIQELELLTIFLDYFASLGENSKLKSNTLFLTLFPPQRSDRLRLLSKFVCMAIFTKNVPVLNAAAVWMQELGCTSELSIKLADNIYLDMFVLVPEPQKCLRDLPLVSPHFTANLLTTFTERFVVKEGDRFKSPPASLLTIVTFWISKNPMLCVAALGINIHLLLLRGVSPRPATSPFGGLIKWCVLTPLYRTRISGISSEGHDAMGVEKDKNMDFSQLHLALVQSAKECYVNKHTMHVKDVVSVQQLCAVVDSICQWAEQFKQMDVCTDIVKKEGEKALTHAMDQFGQVVHLLLAANSVSGNFDELVSKMKILPSNRFLNIILDRINEYKSSNAV